MSTLPSSLTDAVAGAIAGRWTPAQLEAHLISRISRQRVNAVVETRKSVPSRSGGRLTGVPITVKEAIEVAGFRSTWGLVEARENVAETDAAAVALLRRAGANIIGTTNVAAMLADFGQTDNPIHGSTLNPWDLSRTPGGSSGGSAAAVAAGLSFLDIGSDLAGSIRIPAAMCGVLGLKPTPGTVPLGLHPPGVRDVRTEIDFLATLGPIARTPADIRLALDILTNGRPRPAMRAQPTRVGVLTGGGGERPTDPILDAIDHAARALARAGISVTPVGDHSVDFDQSATLFGEALDLYFEAKAGTADRFRVDSLHRVRLVLLDQWWTLFAKVDALMMPVTPITAPPHDPRPIDERTLDIRGSAHPYPALASWSVHATIAGLPALSVPVGLDPDGLPIGLQLVGPPDSDLSLIDLALRLEALGVLISHARYPE